MPRRLVYVVDRRAVVDQATTIADEIKKKSDDSALRVSTLRGQHVDNRAWLEDPAAPAIIVGTVDMIGSRLLFSGYGVSRKMRPYHAGLLGADTLVVLDESHLVPPFERLLEAIATGVDAFGPSDDGQRKIVPPFRLLSLSATGRTRDGEIFRLEEEDVADDVVERRLKAKKRLVPVELNDKKLDESLAEHAWALSGEGTKPVRILVYCSSRETAEKTKTAIRKLAKNDSLELFVGARRVKERVAAAERLNTLGFLAGSDANLKEPAFLIATSAGEVGVDLDADHVVCDLVPWERMVQRLGRVNRLGYGDAQVVLVHEGEPKPKKPDEPKPDELRAIIASRSRIVLDALPSNEHGVDVSPGALRELKLRTESDPEIRRQIEAATTREPLRPALTRALVDAWSMTSLEKHTGRPEIDPWLRGWIEGDAPQTSIVWRTHLPVRREGGEASWKEVEDFFEAAPPHVSEKLETETRRVTDWLMSRALAVLEAGQINTDDVVAFALAPAGDLRKSYRLRDLDGGKDAKRLRDGLERELAGTTLVVDARLKGLKDGLLDKAGSADVRTADDGGDWSTDVRFRIRVSGETEANGSDTRVAHIFATRRSDEGDDIEVLLVEAGTTEESRAASTNPQLLAEHLSWTERRAHAIAEAIGLAGDHKRALTISARLHDEGKKAKRWQRAFNAPDHGKAYAKTKGPINQSRLGGYRHEFGSLPHAERDEQLQALDPDLRDLVLHLIAAHHGRARPVIEAEGCDDAPPSVLEERAGTVALRFARLQKRWGPWGLAWWEALLRAADQQASQDNDKGERADGGG